MNGKITIGLTAAALMACASGAASAATIVAGTRTSSGTKPFTASQTFPSFAALITAGLVPAGSVLTDVSDTLTDVLTGAVSGSNTGTGSGTFAVHAENKAVKVFGTGAGALTVDATTVGNLVSGTLAGGASFGPTPSSGTMSGTAASTVAAVLATFAGPGTVTAAISDGIVTTGTFSFSGSVTSVGTGKLTDVLSYSYTPATATPEPATLALIGTGLVGLAAARRRKRRA